MRHQCDVSEPGRGDAGFHRLLIFEDDGDRAVGVAPALALAVLSQQRPCSIGDLVRGDDTVRERRVGHSRAAQQYLESAALLAHRWRPLELKDRLELP